MPSKVLGKSPEQNEPAADDDTQHALNPDVFAGIDGLSELDQLCRRLASSAAPNDLEMLKSLMVTKAGGTYEKHDVPRVAAAALISRGISGIRELVRLIPQMPGHIYPYIAIRTIWLTVSGSPIPESVVGAAYPSYHIDEETREFSRVALDDLIIEAETTPTSGNAGRRPACRASSHDRAVATLVLRKADRQGVSPL
jgi:hypothetical protein